MTQHNSESNLSSSNGRQERYENFFNYNRDCFLRLIREENDRLHEENLCLVRQEVARLVPGRGGAAVPGGPAAQEEAVRDKATFPPPKVWSELKGTGTADWLWRGYLAKGEITIFSALWKAGKTTLLSHLLRIMEHGGEFCGQLVKPSRVLYVSEESESRWAARGLALGRPGNVAFILRPFLGKPSFARWIEFLDYLVVERERFQADAVILDTISNLWSVRRENDAGEVQEALMPLHKLTPHAAVKLVHHLGKAGGGQGTGGRGSGAILANPDTILELHRYNAGDRDDRRRVLSGWGRWDDTPAELVIELNEDGSGYVAEGNRAEVRTRDLAAILNEIIPQSPPGKTVKELLEAWPGDHGPDKTAFGKALKAGVESGCWARAGEGKKGDGYRYHRGSAAARDVNLEDADLRDPFPPDQEQSP
jgi:hypothetical protein